MSFTVPAPDVSGLRPPRQARSRETFERVLDVGADLFAQVGYDGFSITEVCRLAGISAGAMYARVDSKEALVLAIHDRELARMSLEFDIFADHDRWAYLAAPDLVFQVASELGAHYGRHAHLLRGFFLRAAVDEDMRRHGAIFASALATCFTDLLITRSADFPHPDPVLAVDVTHRMIHASLAWRIAFGESFESDRPISWTDYVAQIASSARSYLLTPL